MRGMLISTCAGRSAGREGTLGKHSYSQENECDSVYPLVHYKSWEGYAVLVPGEGKQPRKWAGVSEPSVFGVER